MALFVDMDSRKHVCGVDARGPETAAWWAVVKRSVGWSLPHL
jgi:hypothetical protein